MASAQPPRLYVDAPLEVGAMIAVDGKQTNFLINVMRLSEGGAVSVFNGADGEWRAEIAATKKRACLLRCVERSAPQTRLRKLCYLFAPLKHARIDYLVQKATEMGASRLMPVLTERTLARPVNLVRMRANAIEAAEQCNLLAIPEICEPCSLATAIADWDASDRLVYCDEAAAATAPLDTLRRVEGQIAGVLTGPEGGFSDAERALLRGRDFVVPVSLGPRVMRADTAAVAALALVQAVSGDWS